LYQQQNMKTVLKHIREAFAAVILSHIYHIKSLYAIREKQITLHLLYFYFSLPLQFLNISMQDTIITS
jgi:hypothetical protein